MAEELRRSQLITNFGVGAIADMKGFSGVLKSPDKWGACHVPMAPLISEERIEEPRLVRRLRNFAVNPHLEFFLMPPGRKDNFENSMKLPFTLFPRMMYCKKCGRLKSFREWFLNGVASPNYLRCTEKNCNGKLIPSRFIMICPKGHLDDFPYSEWVHNYEECHNPQLRIKNKGGSSSLGSIEIHCFTCNKTRTMANALNVEMHKDFVCRGNRPELYVPQNPPFVEGCGVNVEHLKFVLRNAANVYYPKIYSSISIPPFASTIVKEIVLSPGFQMIRTYFNENNFVLYNALLDAEVVRWVEQYNRDQNFFRTLVNQLLNNAEEQNDEESYRFQEYNSFLNIPDRDQNDFVTEDLGITEELKRFEIERVVKAIRIREVRVLAGYSRVRPYDTELPLDGVGEDHMVAGMRSHFIKIVNTNDELRLKFLPGVETFGEGIFISFSNMFMNELENEERIKLRYERLSQNMNNYVADGGRSIPFNSRFVALHTLSHLLINRLSFDSGYSVASIRERIYCNIQHQNNPMNAIFLYTVDTDSEGTMGGLCRLAEPSELLKIIQVAMEASEWCASDPVCRESTGQGLGSLNLAACHSCCLLPENSCEMGNRLLDRTIMDYYF